MRNYDFVKHAVLVLEELARLLIYKLGSLHRRPIWPVESHRLQRRYFSFDP